MRPAWEWNRRLLALWNDAQSTEPHQSGLGDCSSTSVSHQNQQSAFWKCGCLENPGSAGLGLNPPRSSPGVLTCTLVHFPDLWTAQAPRPGSQWASLNLSVQLLSHLKDTLLSPRAIPRASMFFQDSAGRSRKGQGTQEKPIRLFLWGCEKLFH